MKMKLVLCFLFFFLISEAFCFQNACSKSISEDEQLILVGTGAFNDGFYDVAEKEFEIFVRDYANHGKFYDICYLFGKTLLYKGKLREAKTVFLKIITENRSFEYTDYALFWIADVEMKLGDTEEAKKRLLWIIKKFPRFPWIDYSYYILGYLELRSKKFAEAESCFKNVSLLSKSHELIQSSFFWLGFLSWKRNNFEAAADYFHTIWKDPRFLPREYLGYALLWLGEAQLRLGRFNEARSNYRTYCERFKNDLLIPEVYWKLGFCEYRLGNANDAIEIFQSFKNQSNDPHLILSTRYLLGEIFLLRGDYASSIKELSAILDRPQENGLWGGALLNLYWDYVHLGELEEANKIFQRLQRSDHFEDEKMLVQYLKAELIFLEGRIPDSLPYFFNIVNTDYREKALFQIGRGYFFEEKFREAITNLDILILEYPTSKYREESVFIKAECFTKLGNLDQALGAYDLILRENRSSVWQLLALTRVGHIYLSRNENDKAEYAFKTIIQSFQDHPLRFNAAFQLGNLYFRERNIAGAVYYYTVVLKGNMSELFGEVYCRLGEIFYQQGKYGKALASFETAIRYLKENSPWFFLALLEIGNLQRRWGRYEEAKRSYRIILDHSKDEEINKAAKELLNHLES